MAEYIEIGQLWKCETCYHRGPHGCVLGGFGCDHGESYRPDYRKLKKTDIAPVVHGRWIKTEQENGCAMWTDFECSVCGSVFDGNERLFDEWKGCPVCLARMDGE